MRKILFIAVSICVIALTGCKDSYSKTKIESTLKKYEWTYSRDEYQGDDGLVKLTTTLIFEANTRAYDKIEYYYYNTRRVGQTGKWGLHYYISGNTINCVYDDGGYQEWPATRTLTFHDTYLTDEYGNKFERK